jgi:S1-C subfamily serine protease
LIVTNAHVVEGSGDEVLVIKDSQRVEGALRAIDHARDVAVLYAPGLDVDALTIVARPAQRDDLVFTLGHPEGQVALDIGEARVEQSRFMRIRLVGREPTEDFSYLLATDDIYEGNSGGPVIDATGNVVGIVYAGPTDAGPDAKYAFAIAGNEALPVLDDVSGTAVPSGTCPG